MAPPTLAISDSTFGIGRHRLGDLLLVAHHLVIGGALRGFRDDHQLVGILIGDEALGDLDEHVQRGAQHRDEAQHHEHAMAQRHLQRDVVDVQHAIEEPLRDPVEPAALLLVMSLQKPAAQHGRQRDGDHAGDQNRHA